MKNIQSMANDDTMWSLVQLYENEREREGERERRERELERERERTREREREKRIKRCTEEVGLTLKEWSVRNS